MATAPPRESEPIDLTGLPTVVVDDLRRLVQTLRERLTTAPAAGTRKPVGGRLEHLNLKLPTLADIREAREEMWANFPRDVPGVSPS